MYFDMHSFYCKAQSRTKNEFKCELSNCDKIRKAARIRNQYNQAPHLTQDITWESDKTQLNIKNESHVTSPFPAGDHKAARNRRESMTNTRHK